jgi:hypothetical protein
MFKLSERLFNYLGMCLLAIDQFLRTTSSAPLTQKSSNPALKIPIGRTRRIKDTEQPKMFVHLLTANDLLGLSQLP